MSLSKLVCGIAAICALTSISSATPTSVKVKHFDPAGWGWMDNPRADGMAMVKPEGTGCRVHLHVQQFEPNKCYGLALQCTTSFAPDWSNVAAFTTNAGGAATCEFYLPLDLGTAPYFYIYECDGDTSTAGALDVSQDEVRAMGMVGDPTTASVKLAHVTPSGDGTTANPNVDGMAVVSYRSDGNALFMGTDVYLHVQDLTPNTTYGVQIQATGSPIPEDYGNPLAFTTDASGRGTFVAFLPTVDLGTDPKIYIYVWDGNPDTDSYADITTSEARAVLTKN